jgi:hypothetical protein
METFTLTFDKHDEIFRGDFKNIPRDILTRIKEEGYLEKIMVELFPETISGEILIDTCLDNDLNYQIDFYLNMVATPEMKKAINKWKNRNIEINEDDEKIEIHIIIAKNTSAILLSDEKNKLMLTL